MTGQTGVGPLEQRVLGAIGGASRTSEELATQLGEALPDVQDALARLIEAGLARADDGRVWLTDAAGSAQSSWVAHAPQVSAERRAAADALLASDAERDRAVQQLAEAFTQGRLTPEELDERTGRALAARTHGELDAVLDGLGGLDLPTERHPVRTVVFWVATVFLSPFLLLGTLLLLFGSDLGDHVSGLVFLALFAPPLFRLWRWSRRRT